MATLHDIGIAAQIGSYSDGVEVPQGAEDIPAYAAVRKRFLGDARPASMLLIVPALVWPEFLLEVEIVAAKVPA